MKIWTTCLAAVEVSSTTELCFIRDLERFQNSKVGLAMFDRLRAWGTSKAAATLFIDLIGERAFDACCTGISVTMAKQNELERRWIFYYLVSR